LQRGNDIDGENSGDVSGVIGISSNGNVLVIGAGHNDGNGNMSGHARVFSWDGTSWTQIGSDIDGESSGDVSGLGVAISADGARVVVGAFGNAGNGTLSGHVRVYENPSASIEFAESIKLCVYPNPSNGVIQIDLNSVDFSNTKLMVINPLGKIVKESFLTQKKSIVDLEDLPKGTYVIRVISSKRVYTSTFILN
jgi:hypothetical protein